MNNIRKAAFCSLIAVMTITMITSNQLSTYASPTTEDDGWTEGDYEGSPEEQEEQAQEDWEDAGRPGEIDDDDNENDDNDNNDGEQIFTCSDGSTVTGDEECPSTGPNPYCDTPEGKAATICHDRFDTDENGIATCNDGTHKADPKDCKDATKKPLPYYDTPEGKAASSCHDRLDYNDGGPNNGLAPCNDGTVKADWRDCKDVTKKNIANTNTNTEIKTTIIRNAPKLAVQDVPINQAITEPDHNRFSPTGGGVYFPTESVPNPDRLKVGPFGILLPTQVDEEFGLGAIANTNAADISNCKLDGSADGIQQKFDTAKYQACKLHTNDDKIYYDGFVTGCMNVGNTKLICEAVANSNILNINTQNPQTPAATTIPQSSQAIQPAAIN